MNDSFQGNPFSNQKDADTSISNRSDFDISIFHKIPKSRPSNINTTQVTTKAPGDTAFPGSINLAQRIKKTEDSSEGLSVIEGSLASETSSSSQVDSTDVNKSSILQQMNNSNHENSENTSFNYSNLESNLSTSHRLLGSGIFNTSKNSNRLSSVSANTSFSLTDQYSISPEPNNILPTDISDTTNNSNLELNNPNSSTLESDNTNNTNDTSDTSDTNENNLSINKSKDLKSNMSKEMLAGFFEPPQRVHLGNSRKSVESRVADDSEQWEDEEQEELYSDESSSFIYSEESANTKGLDKSANNENNDTTGGMSYLESDTNGFNNSQSFSDSNGSFRSILKPAEFNLTRSSKADSDASAIYDESSINSSINDTPLPVKSDSPLDKKNKYNESQVVLHKPKTNAEQEVKNVEINQAFLKYQKTPNKASKLHIQSILNNFNQKSGASLVNPAMKSTAKRSGSVQISPVKTVHQYNKHSSPAKKVASVPFLQASNEYFSKHGGKYSMTPKNGRESFQSLHSRRTNFHESTPPISSSNSSSSSSPVAFSTPLPNGRGGRRPASFYTPNDSTRDYTSSSMYEEDESSAIDFEFPKSPNDPPPQTPRSETKRFYNDPAIPYTLSLYLQIIVNIVVCSVFVYFLYMIMTTIQFDVDKKVEEYSSEILGEIAECSRQYLLNNCMPGKRAPALETICTSWEKCMNRDPTVVGRARVSAETFSEALEGFIRPLSMKTWSVLLAGVIISFVFPNALFFLSRSTKNVVKPFSFLFNHATGNNPGGPIPGMYPQGGMPQGPPPPPPGPPPGPQGYQMLQYPATPYMYTPIYVPSTSKRLHYGHSRVVRSPLTGKKLLRSSKKGY